MYIQSNKVNSFLTISFIIFTTYFFLKVDLYRLIINFSVDDTFYYYKVAQNFLEYKTFTFDGVNITNGFHPLHTYLLIPIFIFDLSQEQFVFIAKFFEIFFVFVSSILFSFSFKNTNFNYFAILVFFTGVFYSHNLIGMEVSASYLSIFIFIFINSKFVEKPTLLHSYLFAVANMIIFFGRFEFIAISFGSYMLYYFLIYFDKERFLHLKNRINSSFLTFLSLFFCLLYLYH